VAIHVADLAWAEGGGQGLVSALVVEDMDVTERPGVTDEALSEVQRKQIEKFAAEDGRMFG
jgi:hypothetical protein